MTHLNLNFSFSIFSTINPILYNVMSHRYRIAFRETLCGKGNNGRNGLTRDAQSSIRDTMESEYDTRRRSSRQSLSESRRRSSRQIRCKEYGDSFPQNDLPLLNKLNEEIPVNV